MKYLIATGFLILCLSLSYYFVFYLPQKDEKRFLMEQNYKSTQNQNAQAQLQSCYNEANNIYLMNWYKLCGSLGKEEDCLLSNQQANALNEHRNEMNRQCEFQFK